MGVVDAAERQVKRRKGIGFWPALAAPTAIYSSRCGLKLGAGIMFRGQTTYVVSGLAQNRPEYAMHGQYSTKSDAFSFCV
jgi:hypothetical protein